MRIKNMAVSSVFGSWAEEVQGAKVRKAAMMRVAQRMKNGGLTFDRTFHHF